MMTKKSILVTAVLMMMTVGFVAAQSFTSSPQTMTITGTVGEVRRIELPGNQAINLTGDEDGTESIGAMSVFSNTGFRVTVASANGFTLTGTGGSLAYAVATDNGSGDAYTANTAGATVANLGSATGGEITYDMSITYNQGDADVLTPAADYTDTLTFTIGAP
ncbi:MAG: hypothetical protein ACOCYQ_02485 [Alkalispirochaeta sp.]